MWLKAFVLALALCPSIASAQAVWKGRQYSGRVCTNPNCTMCASIQRQIEAHRLPPISAAIATPAIPAVTRNEAAPSQINTLANTELVPTPQVVVEAMLAKLDPSNKAKLFDLGSGDGRICITAAKQYGCTAVGIELNPKTIAVARAAALEEYVNPLVVFFQGDVRAYDLHSAQYVTMYLYPELMAQIVPKLLPGTKIASYQHQIPGVQNTQHSVELNGQPHVFYTGIKQ